MAANHSTTDEGEFGTFTHFVAAKIELEVAIWHPIGLFVYWVLVGTAEGHRVEKIKRELAADSLPTRAGDVALWTPVDILNFWKVPVRLQAVLPIYSMDPDE